MAKCGTFAGNMKAFSISLLCTIVVALTAVSCGSHYELTAVERTRLLVDSRYDGAHDLAADAFMAPYKQQVDSVMAPVVGRTARFMNVRKPESTLSNLLADVLMWCADSYGESPDFAVYNMGGMRAPLPEGVITYGDVLNVAPFENKVCFVTLSGKETMHLFRQLAAVGGEAVSHGVELVISNDRQLLSARLNGEAIDEGRSYRVATIDYVAQGNDKMSAMRQATDVNSPTEEANNVRHIIVKYFQAKAAEGVAVDAEIEGRITIADR